MLFGFVVLHHGRRLLVHVGVTAHPTAEWISHQISEAFLWDRAPRHLIRDRDGAFGETFKKRLHGMGIRDRPTALRSPWQNAYAEHLIGSIRRDCLDHLIIVDERHLRHLLRDYAEYYNRLRTHLSLGKDTRYTDPCRAMGTIHSCGCSYWLGQPDRQHHLLEPPLAKSGCCLHFLRWPVDWPADPAAGAWGDGYGAGYC
jgi:hypothetical protein